MKFRISVPDLHYAARLSRDITPTTGISAEATGVLIDVRGSVAAFTTFGPGMAARALVKVEAKEDGIAAVDAAALFNTISKFQPLNDRRVGTSDITVSMSRANRKLKFSAKTTYPSGKTIPHTKNLKLLNSDFFPEFPAVAPEVKASLEGRVLTTGIESVIFAASTDKTRILYTGIYVKLENNKITFAAADGLSIAEYEDEVEYEGEPVEYIIPSSLASKILKNFFDTDKVEIGFTKKMGFFVGPNTQLVGSLINESFPDYKSFIPEPSKVAVVDKMILHDNLNNLIYEASQVEGNRVRFKLEKNVLSLISNDSINEGIPVDFDGSCEIDFNLKQILPILNALRGEQIRIGILDKSKVIRFMPQEGVFPSVSAAVVQLNPI